MKISRVQIVDSCEDCKFYLSEIDGKNCSICIDSGKFIPKKYIIRGTFPHFCKLKIYGEHV